jgi:hypothetical protein
MTVFPRFLPETTALQLDSWHLDDAATLLILHVTSTQRLVPCPVCAVFTARVHSRYTRTLDTKAWDEFAETMVPDVTADYGGLAFEDRDALVAYMLEGDGHVAGHVLYSGDFYETPAGSVHDVTYTEEACVFLLIASRAEMLT